MTSRDSKTTVNAVPGPVVLVVRDGGDLIQRCELALQSLQFVRVRSCVADELFQAAAALQPVLIVAASGSPPLLSIANTAILEVGPEERGAELEARLIESIRRSFIP